MDIGNLISMGIVFAIALYFSRKAQTLFFHLLYAYLGVYLLFTAGFNNPLYNQKFIVGVALLAPQLTFLVQFTRDTILNIKMMTANTYYFFITLYYKVIRFIHWVQSIPKLIQIFFTTFGSQKEEYHQKEESSYNKKSHYEKSEKFYEEKEEPYQEPQTDFSQKETPKQEHGEFAQFYSGSAYTVLGVSSDDDFKTIKKAYRKLVREYHPDLNPENIKLYTEITQQLNDAYEKIEQWKK